MSARLTELATSPQMQTELRDMFLYALTTDGAYHKQWWLETIAGVLGFNFADEEAHGDFEPGTPP